MCMFVTTFLPASGARILLLFGRRQIRIISELCYLYNFGDSGVSDNSV